MGTCCMSWLDVFWNQRRSNQGMQIAILGLDNAGKTCLLYRLKYGHYRATAQTCGFNCERMKVGPISPAIPDLSTSSISSSSSTSASNSAEKPNFRPVTAGNAPRRVNFCLFDVAGHEKLRPLWRTYTKNCDGIIFVIDSAESAERLEETRLELIKTIRLCPEAPLIVVCNKQDLPAARMPSEIAQLFKLKKELRSRRWALTGGCAITGEGYDEPNCYANDENEENFDTSSRLADQTPLLELMFQLIFQSTAENKNLPLPAVTSAGESSEIKRRRKSLLSLNRVAAVSTAGCGAGLLNLRRSQPLPQKNIAKLFS